MTDPDAIIATMARQREQERSADEAHYKLRKACQARAVELHKFLVQARGALSDANPEWRSEWEKGMLLGIDTLLQEIQDASH